MAGYHMHEAPALVLASAEAFMALKLIGAVSYDLMWIGVRSILAAQRDAAPSRRADAHAAMGRRRAFREDVVVEALNPKTAAFFRAFIPQFVDVSAGHVAFQFALLGMISVIFNTLAALVVALVAGRAQAGLGSRTRLVRRLREVSGGAMIALGLSLLLARRPTD